MTEHKCSHCKKVWAGRKSRFCSERCRRKAYDTNSRKDKCACGANKLKQSGHCNRCATIKRNVARTRVRTCMGCGCNFNRKRSGNKGLYCSRECAFKNRPYLSEARQTAVSQCKQCKVYMVGMKGKYCSGECRVRWSVVVSSCPSCGYTEAKARASHAATTDARCDACKLASGDYRLSYKGSLAKAYHVLDSGEVHCKRCSIRFEVGKRASKIEYCEECRETTRREYKSGTSNHRKRARRHGVEYQYINHRKVFARDGWRCQGCEREIHPETSGLARHGPTLDHVVPMSTGGGHTYDNVQLLCRSCNGLKSDKLDMDELKRLVSIV